MSEFPSTDRHRTTGIEHTVVHRTAATTTTDLRGEAARRAAAIQLADLDLRTRVACHLNGRNKRQTIAGATKYWLIGAPGGQASSYGLEWSVETEQAGTMLDALAQIDSHRRQEDHYDGEKVFTPLAVLNVGPIDQMHHPRMKKLIAGGLWIDFPTWPRQEHPSQRERLVAELAAAGGALW